MSREIRFLRSKINLLNGHIAHFHQCGLFSPEEVAELTAPLVPQVQELNAKIVALQHGVAAQECQNELQARKENAADALTPINEQADYELR